MRIRLVVAVTLLLALLAAACTGQDAPEAAEEPTGGPAEEATDEPTASPGDEDASAAPPTVAEIIEQVGALRGLDAETGIKAELLDDEEFTALLHRVQQEGEERNPPVLDDETGARLLQALRFLPEGADLTEIRDQFLEAGVEGVYVPQDQAFYVRSSTPELGPYTAVVAAHEITHALQDQAFGLERLEEIDDGDAFLAFHSVVEGDAVLVMQLWSAEHQSVEDQLAIQSEVLGQDTAALDELPPYVLDVLTFPYLQGAQFVSRLVAEDGFDAVDRALQDPPTTSAEIYDPQRYLDGFTPETVEVTADPGQEWEQVVRETFGAFDLRQMLSEVDASLSERVGGAWTGGTLAAWARGEDLALAGALRFATPEVAAEACEALPEWYATVAGGAPGGDGLYEGDRDVMSLRCDDGGVHLALAPDAATAAALAAP